MSLEKSFLILETPVYQPDLALFVGRIVADPRRPWEYFIPPSQNDAAQQTNSIVPGILPHPRVTRNQKEAMSSDAQATLESKLSSLLEMEFARSEGHSRWLKSEEIKTYSLENVRLVFKTLMQNQSYADHARELLGATWPRQAYFITGFVTARNSEWVITDSSSSKGAAKATLPINQMAGVPADVLGESLGVSGQASNTLVGKRSRQMNVEAEEIIAVSYFTVRFKYGIDLSSRSITREPAVGKARRAKNSELAMGAEDGEDDEVEFDSDSEAEDNYGNRKTSMGGINTGSVQQDYGAYNELLLLNPLSLDSAVAPYADSHWLSSPGEL